MTSQSDDAHWQRPDEAAAPNHGSSGPARLVEPDDDLPSPGYGGDFETTTIPPYQTDMANLEPSGYSLLEQPEPLPYVQPQAGGRHALIGSDDADLHEGWADDRRGTQDLGLLVLRAGLGALLVAHGLQKLFGWWGGTGLTGFKGTLADAGYQHADILSYVAIGGEITAGVLLVLGLFTPVAAAGALAYLINNLLLEWADQPNGRHFPFFLPGGHEYRIVLIVLAVVVILVGPGRYGFDAGRGWARRPFLGSALALVLGIGGGIAIWVLLNGANPLA